MVKRFSVLICCFGNYPEYSLRAVDSVLSEVQEKERPFDLHIGANACCGRTISELRRRFDEGKVDSLVQSNENINKDPMKRLLLDLCRTEYAIWLDDDTYFHRGWLEAYSRFIEKHHPFDVAGKLHVCKRDPDYLDFLRKRPWFIDQGKFDTHLATNDFNSDIRSKVSTAERNSIFAVGGLEILRVPFLLEQNFPDKAMVKAKDDMLLGDLVAQSNARILEVGSELRSLVEVDKGERRGTGEGKEFFRDVCPVTGEALNKSESIAFWADKLQEEGKIDQAIAEYRRSLEALERSELLTREATDSVLRLCDGPGKDARTTSILVGCYGNYPELASRCIESIISENSGGEAFPLHVGATECGPETTTYLRKCFDGAKLETLIETRSNINKDPMMRLLIDRCTSRYFMWLDDDSHLCPGWKAALEDFLHQTPAFDLAGLIHFHQRNSEYKNFLKKRPWFVSEAQSDLFKERCRAHPELRTLVGQDMVVFVPGGIFLASVPFVRRHNFPDKAMIKEFDDRLLGDLVAQQSGRLVNVLGALRAVWKLSDSERRGFNSRYMDVDPRTGRNHNNECPALSDVTYRHEEGLQTGGPCPRTAEQAGSPLPGRTKEEEAHWKSVKDHVELNEIGNKLTENGKLQEAIEVYKRALQISPATPELYFNIANNLRATGDVELAIEHFRRSIELRPNYPHAYNNLGLALQGLGQHELAIETFRKGADCSSRFAAIYNNLAIALEKSGELDEATAWYRKALAIEPRLPQAHKNLAHVLARQGNDHAAFAHYRAALHYEPNFHEARLDRALFLLSRGEWELGLHDYEARLKCRPKLNRHPEKPLWNGAYNDQLSLLVYQEQGFGDTIQFARFLRIARTRVKSLVVQCHPSLVRLLGSIPDVEVRAFETSLPDFDAVCPIMSLPFLLGLSGELMGAPEPYLGTYEGSVVTFPPNATGSLRVGIVWRGSVNPEQKQRRSLSLEDIQSIFDVPGVQFFSLQKGLTPDEQRTIDQLPQLHDLSPQLFDFAQTATAIKGLDLVLSIDTAAAHLAGALAVPCWVVVGHEASWQWMTHGEESPWYPSVRIVRSQSAENWTDAISTMHDLLKRRVLGRFEMSGPLTVRSCL